MIKAIDTRYKGYKFRSRLEARFAVFLDALNVDWDYEIEGFDLPHTGKYLPDFFLPNGGIPEHYTGPMWIEVKATRPTVEEVNKLRELAVTTQVPGAFFRGASPPNVPNTFKGYLDPIYDGCGIPVLDDHQIPLDFFAPAPKNLPASFWEDKNNRDLLYDWYTRVWGEMPINTLRIAAKAALAARFEFGESG